MRAPVTAVVFPCPLSLWDSYPCDHFRRGKMWNRLDPDHFGVEGKPEGGFAGRHLKEPATEVREVCEQQSELIIYKKE